MSFKPYPLLAYVLLSYWKYAYNLNEWKIHPIEYDED